MQFPHFCCFQGALQTLQWWGEENKTLQNPQWDVGLLLCINREGLCCSFSMSLCSSSIWRVCLIRVLLGSIPHPAHLFPVHEPLPCPLEMAPCPQPEGWSREGGVLGWQTTAGAKQGVVPGGKNCRHPEEASPSSPSPYKCAVRHIFLLKCWAWKLRQVQGRMRSMGKLGAVGTWKGTLQHKKKYKAGFLFWGIVAFLCLLHSEMVLRCTLLIVLATFFRNCTGIRMRNGKEFRAAKDWSSERSPNKKGVADFYQGGKLVELHSHGR